MKKVLLSVFTLVAAISAFAQTPQSPFKEKTVYKNEEIEIRQIDEHTWHGSGKMMSSEAIYIVEGEERALVIDAGTNIKDFDKIIKEITSKPITLVATHVHPDHTGPTINLFDEIHINAADMVNVAMMMPDYKGTIKYLADGQVFDLGGREIEVVFTPGHTPGSTSFFDKEAGYGFSGDAFGSGYLLLITNFTTLKYTCMRSLEYMQKNNIRMMYPGHYNGSNEDYPSRLEGMVQVSQDVLEGKVQGKKNEQGMLGLNWQVFCPGACINYNESALK